MGLKDRPCCVGVVMWGVHDHDSDCIRSGRRRLRIRTWLDWVGHGARD